MSLLTVPSFAQTAAEHSTPASTALAARSGSTNLPLIAGEVPDVNLAAQPAAAAENPEPIAPSYLPDLHKAMKAGLDGQGQQLTTTHEHHGVQRPGFLVLGIAGAAAMGAGAWVYSLHGGGSAKTTIGTMFMAPGAVAAGFGFTWAFKPHNR